MPVVYEKEPLGILAVDNSTSNAAAAPERHEPAARPGLAAGHQHRERHPLRTGAGEREEVPRARRDRRAASFCASTRRGRITFVNEFAQRLFDFTARRRSWERRRPRSSSGTGSGPAALRAAHRRDEPRPDAPGRPGERAPRCARANPSGSPGPIGRSWTPAAVFAELLCIGNDITELKRARAGAQGAAGPAAAGPEDGGHRDPGRRRGPRPEQHPRRASSATPSCC
ncbi:MAG: hypothetical protein MZV70_02865 [Desulfobacterales bacterium]|nr:hypothetical protein [Desulfobacterales bacterium]